MSSTEPTFHSVSDAAKRIAPYVFRTPLLRNTLLDEMVEGTVLIKPECLQRTGSFKMRGASNALLSIPEAARKYGVVAHSSGNHAQAIACAANALRMKALVAMPIDAPKVKIEATRRWGAEIHFFDRNTTDRDKLAGELVNERKATLVPPYEHPDVIAGQGTAALEVFESAHGDCQKIDILAMGTSGGGLLAGCALAASGLSPATQLWGVEPEGWDDFGCSLRAGERVSASGDGDQFCDAILARCPGELTFAINRKRVSGALTVSRGDVIAAMKFAFEHLKLVVEPGGCVALAALLSRRLNAQGKTVAIILTGGNADFPRFREVM